MIETEIYDIRLKFETDPLLFSPKGIDAGTLAMLSQVVFSENDKVLDLGCGYGVVGISAAVKIGEEKVLMCDISEKAVSAAKANAALNGVPGVDIRVSDGFRNIPENDFTLILSNPPYHTDFSVARRFIEDGFKSLTVGGRMVMVTKRQDWYKNKLSAVFGGVRVRETGGYYVFIAEKRSARVKAKEKNTGALSKKLQRKQKKKAPPTRKSNV